MISFYDQGTLESGGINTSQQPVCQGCGGRLYYSDGYYQNSGHIYACDNCIHEYVLDGHNADYIIDALKELDYCKLSD